MLNVLLYAVLLAQPGLPQSKSAPVPPVEVSEREAAEHRLDRQTLFLRVPKQHGFEDYLEISVTVDRAGSVISTHIDTTGRNSPYKNSPAILADAEAMVRSLKFSPFTRGGKPVVAQFTENVFLLPPELKPAKHVPFPRVKDWNSVRIGLSRSGCLGTCPSYSVEIAGDGSVTYDGRSFVTFTGHHRGFTPPRNVIDLVRQFEKADFYSLADKYTTSVTDNPTYTLNISIDGMRKQVVDYVGLQSGMPLAVSKLEDEVDRISGSERWLTGNAETVPALEAEHWDFKSAEAAATLARAAERGNAAVVRDLVQAGVPVIGRYSANMLGYENDRGRSPALVLAAGRGDVEMIRALASGGAVADSRALSDAVVAAARSGNLDAYRLLLNYGAPANPRDSGGATALMAAAASGYPAMVRELLERHADVNAARIAPPHDCGKDVDCEEENGDGRTALMEAVKASDYDVPSEGVDRVEVVRLLLAAGANVTARDKQGNTALILCSDSAEEAELLLQAGADPNARNLEGKTALEDTYDDDVKRVLRSHGAVEVKATTKEQ
jgi:ankyrin repeat protein